MWLISEGKVLVKHVYSDADVAGRELWDISIIYRWNVLEVLHKEFWTDAEDFRPSASWIPILVESKN